MLVSNFGPGPYITPGRDTIVTLDMPDWTTVQQPFDREFYLDQIGPSNIDSKNNVEYIPKKGWTLTSSQSQLQQFHELGVGAPIPPVVGTDNGFLFAGDGTNSGWLQKNLQRANSDLPGVDVTNITTTGDTFNWKFVGATQTFDQSLAPDQTAFPSPFPGDDNITMDRVAVSNFGMTPTHDLIIRFDFGGVSGAGSPKDEHLLLHEPSRICERGWATGIRIIRDHSPS